MKKFVWSIAIILFEGIACQVWADTKPVKVSSPDGSITVGVGVKANQPYYIISRNGQEIVTPSHLGFQLDKGVLGANMKMTGKRFAQNDETWLEVWGEEELVRNHYNELTVTFEEKKGDIRQMEVVFRVFNDGVGFRYIIPNKHNGNKYCLMDESTEITLAHDAKAWSIPSNRTAYFEGIFTPDMLSRKDTVCTPLTIEYEDNLYLAIHEAALEEQRSLPGATG